MCLTSLRAEDADVQRGSNPGEAVEAGPRWRSGSGRGVLEELELGRAVPEPRKKSGCDDHHRIKGERGNQEAKG
jgi:hypothetical protein